MHISDKGVYCLLLKNTQCTIRVGSLGDLQFRQGFHIYVGSARGPGDLKRVARHVRFASEKDKVPRWHIDHLNLDSHFELVGAVCAATSKDMECSLAGSIGGESVPNFGCSDCSCGSHLFYREFSPLDEVRTSFVACGLEPVLMYGQQATDANLP